MSCFRREYVRRRVACYVADRFQSLLQLARYRRVAVAGSRCQQVSVNMNQPAILGLCKTGNPFPNIRTSTRMKIRSSLAVFADENAVNWLDAQCIYDDLFIMRPSSLGGPHIASHSVCPSVCPSVPLSLPSVTSRHLANYNDTCTFRHALRAAYRTAISAAQACLFHYS